MLPTSSGRQISNVRSGVVI